MKNKTEFSTAYLIMLVLNSLVQIITSDRVTLVFGGHVSSNKQLILGSLI